MTLGAVVCAATLAIGVVRDVTHPVSDAVEVWFGFELYGWPAVLTSPIHWAIFAVFAWSFWNARTSVVPWVVAYLFYAAFAHLVWSEASPHGRGWLVGLVQAVAISSVAMWLLRRHREMHAP
jgi:hypothetical protein